MRIEQSVQVPVIDIRLRLEYRTGDGFVWEADL